MIKIRKYNPADEKRIVEIFEVGTRLEPWPQIYPGGWDYDRIVFEFLPLDRYKDALFLVGEVDGVVMGMIAGHPLKLFLENEITHMKGLFENVEESFYQRDIMLDPNIRHGHLAHQLFNELKRFAVSEGFQYMVTRTPPLNEPGIHFFHHLGYRDTINDDNPKRIYFVMPLGMGQ